MDNEVTPASLNVERLKHLADLNRVATSYQGWTGEFEDVAPSSLLKVMKAMMLPIGPDSTDEDVEMAIRVTEDEPWTHTLPPCTVVRKGDWRDLWVHVDDGQNVHVWYELEDGAVGDLHQLDRPVPPREVKGVWRGRATFEVPGTLPLGYHKVHARVDDGPTLTSHLYIVPQRIEPTLLRGAQRYWGVNAQAYSVMSKDSWGVGDTRDLSNLMAVCAQEGADFVLINPLHASEIVDPIDNSPYRPASRRFLNVTYVHPELIPEYARLTTEQRGQIEGLRASVSNTDDQAEIKRGQTWAAKDTALRLIYQQPRDIYRQAQFGAFIVEGGEDLYNYALWCAITDKVGSTDLPEKYDSPTSSAAEQFAAENDDLVGYYMWLQWTVSEQLIAANKGGQSLGMGIGIMADLAVGIHPSGSDFWSNPDIFASGMYVGAPPDMYSQKGQNWTQPPWIPSRLAQQGYEPFKQVIRAALKLAGALRIDHILGLFRLWWLPAGETAAEGSYVYFDHEAMVGILLLEAHRQDAILIGEDLGTMEPWVRSYLQDRGILGTSVFWFERDDQGVLLSPDLYRSTVLATVNTHDMPPTIGYLKGVQTTLRDQLDLLMDPVDVVRARDKVELQEAFDRLSEQGLLGEDATNAEVLAATQRFVCRTPARLVAAALVDQVGELRPQNIPGTEHEYPNWRIPLADQEGHRVWIEDLELASTRPGEDSLFGVMREEFGRGRRGII